jgi:hypothetical protein
MAKIDLCYQEEPAPHLSKRIGVNENRKKSFGIAGLQYSESQESLSYLWSAE